MTPYINTYPDFLAGALVMSFALLVAAGLDRSKTLQRWINCLTCSALVVVLLIGAWDANIETYKKQAFLFNGSHGVFTCIGYISEHSQQFVIFIKVASYFYHLIH